MQADIYQFFPHNTRGESYGLFPQFYPKRVSLNGLRGNGRSHSDWGMCDVPAVEGGRYTILDMFHGYCVNYAYYFHEKNPDWDYGFLMYDSWVEERYKHAFLIKKTADGRTLFADARGITDNVDEFFSDFSFSKRSMHVYTPDTGDPNTYRMLVGIEKETWDESNWALRAAVQGAYEKVYVPWPTLRN